MQRERDAGPLHYHEDPFVVHTGMGAREVREENSRIFRVTGSERDRSGLTLENVVRHDALGHTPLRRMDALYGILPKTSTHSRSDDFAITLAQGQGSQGLRLADQQTLSVGITTFGDEHGAGRSEGSQESGPQQHCLASSKKEFSTDTACREVHTFRCPSGPGADSHLEASISSNALTSVVQFMPRVAGSTKRRHRVSLFFGNAIIACPDDAAPVLAKPSCRVVRIKHWEHRRYQK